VETISAAARISDTESCVVATEDTRRREAISIYFVLSLSTHFNGNLCSRLFRMAATLQVQKGGKEKG
jgi:hypothetical protein